MTSDPSAPMDIRRLGTDTSFAAALESLRGSLMRIQLLEDDTAQFTTGTLVEVRNPETLYLGEVRSRENDLLTIGIEHSLNRESLRAIQRVWAKPGTPTE